MIGFSYRRLGRQAGELRHRLLQWSWTDLLDGNRRVALSGEPLFGHWGSTEKQENKNITLKNLRECWGAIKKPDYHSEEAHNLVDSECWSLSKPKSGNLSLLLPNPTGTVQDDNGTISRGTTSCCDYPPCLCLFVHSPHLYMCACVRALEIAKRSHVSALRPPPWVWLKPWLITALLYFFS